MSHEFLHEPATVSDKHLNGQFAEADWSFVVDTSPHHFV